MSNQDDQLVQIHWNCGSIDEARKVSRFLVQERYVACANIVPWIESVYMWDNQMHTEQETKVIFTTRAGRYSAVREVIEKNTSYEVPEIALVRVDEINQPYADWALNSTPASSATPS